MLPFHYHGYPKKDIVLGDITIPKDMSLRLFNHSDTQYQLFWLGNVLNLDKSLFIIHGIIPVTYTSVISD